MAYLITGAKVLSSESPYSFPARDVFISDEGIIEKVALPGKLSASSTHSDVVDAKNKILLPGLINTHTHAPMSLLRGVGDDLHLPQWLRTCMWPREARMDAKTMAIGTQLAACEMIRVGTTTFNEHYFHMDAIARVVDESGMRACLGYSMIDRKKSGDGIEFDFDGKGKDELAIGEKFAKEWNGKADGRITTSISPHATNTCSKELLVESARLAKRLDVILHIHLAETRTELAETLGLYKKRPAEFLDSCGCLLPSTVAAHGVYVSKSEVKLLASRKSSIAHCPVSNLKLASGGAAPIPEYLAAGVNVSLGTDGAASNNSLDMFESMKVGAIEQKNFRFDAAAVKADDYLKMATEAGAKALGIKAGVIKPGHLADLVLIDAKSPNLVPFTDNAGWLVYSAGPQNVTDTMVNGKWLMRERKLLTLDEEKILSTAQKTADGLK